MRIAIETLGTRGDVQPYLALARALQARGHTVQLAAPMQFAVMAEQFAVPFAPLPGEFLALLDTPEGKAAVAGGQGFSAGFKLLKHVRPLMRRLLDTEWLAVRAFAPDLLVYHPKSIASPHMAEALAIPHVLASPLPGFTPTAAFPSPMLPFATLGPLNRVSHQLAIHGADMLFGKLLRQWRSEVLGLPGKARHRPPVATLYAYSRHVVPVPSDWDSTVLVSGYWFLDEPDWTMPEDLAGFLAAGEKPVYIGFGSMPGLDPETLAATAIAALAQTGQRGLLAIGGGALSVSAIPDHVHVIAAAPHGALFRHVRATVHHGGAGTTAASIVAGVPTTLCPFFGDQPFWARRVFDLGIGPAPLDRKRLGVDQFAAALQAMTDPAMAARAAALGARLRAEDGTGAAAQFLESLAA
jgi:UDP:flavonoid glycosyltransferase YjiC (YdhE family)